MIYITNAPPTSLSWSSFCWTWLTPSWQISPILERYRPPHTLTTGGKVSSRKKYLILCSNLIYKGACQIKVSNTCLHLFWVWVCCWPLLSRVFNLILIWMSIQIIETTRNNGALSKKKGKKSHLTDLPDVVSTHFLLVSTLTPLPKHLTLDKAKMLLYEIEHWWEFINIDEYCLI